MPLFLTQKFLYKIHKQTRILLFHLKDMKYSATLPMFLVWRENLLSYDNIRVFFFFRTLRRSKDVIFHEKIFTKFYLTCLENNLFNF